MGNPENPAIVLLHGFAAGSGHWRHNAAEIASAGWCVYGLDLIGFGASSQPGSLRLDNRLWARQVQGFLQEVVGGSAVLVGHSLGGLVALTCSVMCPRLVEAVVAAPLPDPVLLMATPETAASPWRRPPWRRNVKKWLVEGLCRILPLEVLVPVLAHSPLLDLGIQAAYSKPVIGDQDLHRVIARPARRGGAVRSLRAMSIGMALRPQGATAPTLLNRLSLPMLLVWGEQDMLVPLQVGWQCQRLRRELPLALIPAAGHCPHDEQPDIFNEVLLAWLNNLSIPSEGKAMASPERCERLA